MRYVCLFYGEDETFSALSGQELQALQTGCMDYDRQLARDGYLVLAQPLKSARDAKSVRVRGRKATVTDGPFAEVKEQLLGFVLLEVPDEAKAVELAGLSPLSALGTAEVRPAMPHPSTERLEPGGSW
jgi:hypothetical protein